MSAAKKATIYLCLTVALSWTPLGVAWAAGARNIAQGGAGFLGFLLGPALAAVLCAALFDKGARVKALGIAFRPNAWWLAALVAPFILAPAGAGAVLALSPYPFAGFGQLGFSALFPAKLAIAALFAIPEELGWRGYLYAQWRRFAFWRASLATGLVWAAWHWPAMILLGLNSAPDHAGPSLLVFTLQTVLLAPMMALMRDRGRSIWAPVIFHGASNAVTPLVLSLWGPPAFPWDWAAMAGAAGLGVLLIAVVPRDPSGEPVAVRG